MKKSNEFIEDLKRKEIGTKKEMDHSEYLVQLKLLEKEIGYELSENFTDNDLRVSKSIKKLNKLSEIKGIRSYPIIKKAIKSLENLNKEICISQAGANAEKRVAKSISRTYLDDYSLFQNIYIGNELGETELDDVVITRKGILILEVKGTKDNILISEQGKIVHQGREQYDDKILGEQMNNKRFLLTKLIDEELEKRNKKIDLMIDSYVVFDTPKTRNVTVKDEYKAEKYCFTSKLPFIIENLKNDNGKTYSLAELNLLNEILEDAKGKRKEFETELNFEIVINDFGNALELLGRKKESKIVQFGSQIKNFIFYIKQYKSHINLAK